MGTNHRPGVFSSDDYSHQYFWIFYCNLVPYIQEHSLFGEPVYVGPDDSEMQTFSHI